MIKLWRKFLHWLLQNDWWEEYDQQFDIYEWFDDE